MKQLVIATMNPGKLRELAAALEPAGLEILGLEHLGSPTEVEETGATFEENARLKAEEYSSLTDLPVLADDSGLEVDALEGAPGVMSARFGGPGLTDKGRTRALLDVMRGVDPDKRIGRFRCVLALARRGTTVALFEGKVEGIILAAPRGQNGFGYDPVFFHPESGCSFAELAAEEKQRHSHRGAAITAFLEALERGDPRLADAG